MSTSFIPAPLAGAASFLEATFGRAAVVYWALLWRAVLLGAVLDLSWAQ